MHKSGNPAKLPTFSKLGSTPSVGKNYKPPKLRRQNTRSLRFGIMKTVENMLQ